MRQVSLVFASVAILLCAGCKTPTQDHLPVGEPSLVGMDEKRLEQADQVIEQSIANGEVPGAVLAVVRHDKLVYLKAYGNRQVEPDTLPMTVNTIFDMASISKCVGTTLSMMQLIEQGKVRLQDAVSLYISGFEPWKDPLTGETQTITVQDLMTHTSGLPAYGPTEDLVAQYGEPAPEGLLEYICHCPRNYRPTTGYEYSCLNFITIQNIIQKITGQRLCDYAQEHVFDVLDLHHTMYLPLDTPVEGVSATERESVVALCCPTEVQSDGKPFIGQVHDPLARRMNAGNSGNAGVFSNAEDLAVIALALLNGGAWDGARILAPATVQAMTAVPASVEVFQRTLGWDRGGSCNGNLFNPATVYGHTGYTGTTMVIDPSADVAVILLTNRVHPHDGGSAVRLRTLVANVVAGAIVD